MKLDWTPLRVELDRWRSKGMQYPIWWRDDDAIRPTEALDELAVLSDTVGVPVHLAVIPREATMGLAGYVQDRANLLPVVHGWSHTNHQPEETTKCEFGENRPLEARREEAAEGLRRLTGMFGEAMTPMFVPPWNRVPDSFLPDLADVGYKSVSTCHPRERIEAANGLLQINTHIDPLYWRPSRGLSEPQLIIEKVVRLLKKRRQGKLDHQEPFGLLTHHLAHTPDVWEFCRQYWLELTEGPFEIFEHP